MKILLLFAALFSSSGLLISLMVKEEIEIANEYSTAPVKAGEEDVVRHSVPKIHEVKVTFE